MVIKNHIAPKIDDIALCDLTPAVLQTWINDKFREKYSEKSMSIFRCVMNGALRHAETSTKKGIERRPKKY